MHAGHVGSPVDIESVAERESIGRPQSEQGTVLGAGCG
jgi:hypothetical protein